MNESEKKEQISVAESDCTSVEMSKTKAKRDYIPHRRVSMRVCKDCGKFYVLSDKDALYFLQNFGTLPLRCEECRKRSRGKTEDKSET